MDKLHILQHSDLFENLLPEELSMLADLSIEKRFAGNEVVFREGEAGDSLYIIAKGEVDVVGAGQGGEMKTLARLTTNQFFGEMSLIDKELRSATVRAHSDAVLLQLTNGNLYSFAKVYKNGFTLLVINIARTLSARLRETNRRLAERL